MAGASTSTACLSCGLCWCYIACTQPVTYCGCMASCDVGWFGVRSSHVMSCHAGGGLGHVWCRAAPRTPARVSAFARSTASRRRKQLHYEQHPECQRHKQRHFHWPPCAAASAVTSITSNASFAKWPVPGHCPLNCEASVSCASQPAAPHWGRCGQRAAYPPVLS